MTLDVYVTNYSGAWLAALPEASIENITQTLNEPDSMDFSLPQGSPGAEMIGGWETEIQVREVVEAEGINEIVFQGPMVSESGNQHTASFKCEGVLSHFGTRIVDRTSLLYTSIEQRTIALELINYAQSETVQANRNFNVVGAPFSGITQVRSRNYPREEHAFILDLLQEFPTLNNGFDFDIVIQPDGARWWTPYHPKKGSVLTDLKVEMDETDSSGVVDFSYRRDYKRLATHIYATGGSSGDVKFEENFEDIAASATYKVRQDVVSEGGQLDVAWLLARATREVGQRKRPILVPVITMSRYPIDYKRKVHTGDYLPLRIQRGRISITEPRRVLQKKWNIAPDTVSLSVAEVP